MLLITLPYLLMGGFKAVVTTDVLQYLMLLGLGVVLILSVFTSGSFSLPPASTVWSMDVSTVAPMIVLGALWVFVDVTVWQRIFACKSVKQAKRGMAWSLACYYLITPIACAPFLLSYYLKDSFTEMTFLNEAFLYAFYAYLAPILLMMLFVSIMSTIDTAAFGAAMSVTNDFCLKVGLISKDKITYWTRIVLVVSLAGAAGIAILSPSIMTIVYMLIGVASCMAPALLFSLFNNLQFSERSVFYSVVSGVICYFIKTFFTLNSSWWDLLPLVIASLTLFGLSRLDSQGVEHRQ